MDQFIKYVGLDTGGHAHRVYIHGVCSISG